MISLKDIITEAAREALSPVGKVKVVKKAGNQRNSLKEQVKKSTSWGQIPELEELEELMNGEGFNMELRGADSIAWEYAMSLSPDLAAGGTDSPEQLKASVEALVSAPDPDELSDEQFQEVEHLLDKWDERYGGDHRIEEAAWSLASSIMEVLDIEWI